MDAHAAADLLLQIEAEMRRKGLWGGARPAKERLASSMPFACDALSFPEWMQWLFIPRMKALLESGSALPDDCNIHPYAEQWFEEHGLNPLRLMRLIRKFDRQLSGEH